MTKRQRDAIIETLDFERDTVAIGQPRPVLTREDLLARIEALQLEIASWLASKWHNADAETRALEYMRALRADLADHRRLLAELDARSNKN